jgi:hypothetical protein
MCVLALLAALLTAPIDRGCGWWHFQGHAVRIDQTTEYKTMDGHR